MVILKKVKLFIKNLFKDEIKMAPQINKSFISVNGIEDKRLEDKLYTQIINYLMKAPLESRPMACSCIRKDANDYYGIFRTGSMYGHYTKKVYGKTQSEVIKKLIVTLKKEMINFPEKLSSYPLFKAKCNMVNCPAGYAKAYTHKYYF